MTPTINVAILGATGFGAGELLRLLVHHPNVVVVAAVSSSQAGRPVAEAHPHLVGFYEQLMVDEVDLDRLLDAEHGVVFSALPHGASGDEVSALLEKAADHAHADRFRIVDLSGDLRLQDLDMHSRYYAQSPALEELRVEAAYGLPEINREAIVSACLVANPGCLASAAILATMPAVSSGFRGPVAIDAKTGSSGSGRKLKETTHHPTRRANFRAYKPLGHQHEPEILQALQDPRGERLELSFVPQSMDATRGIYVTAHFTMPTEEAAAGLLAKYAAYYASSPFVRMRAETPELQNVVGSNFCDISLAHRGRQVIAMAALDNLIKGMSGTAIQNMNLICGLPEKTGLWWPSLRPI